MPHHCPVQRASFRSGLARLGSISISLCRIDDVGLLRAAARRLEAFGHSLGIVGAESGIATDLRPANSLKVLEAPPGFEPGMEVLQTSALPLGDGALN